MAKSKIRTFEGYSFSVAMYRNKDNIKGLVTIITGWNAFLISNTGFDWKAFGLSIAIGVVTLCGKLLSDAVDFYFSEPELN